MAVAAKVPIVLAAGDFKRNIVYLGYKISVEKIESVPYEEILQEISDYFVKHDITPKIAENWNPDIS